MFAFPNLKNEWAAVVPPIRVVGATIRLPTQQDMLFLLFFWINNESGHGFHVVDGVDGVDGVHDSGYHDIDHDRHIDDHSSEYGRDIGCHKVEHHTYDG